MAKIEERVLSMRFDNAQFKRASADTISTLETLREKMNFKGLKESLKDFSKPLDNLERSLSKTRVGPIFSRWASSASQAASSIERSFSNSRIGSGLITLSNTAATAFGNISSRASSVDLSPISRSVEDVKSSFSALDLVTEGAFRSIGANLASKVTGSIRGAVGKVMDPIVQGGMKRATNIEQAEFMLGGLGMDVEAVMESANAAVTGTAYGLDVAAKAAAQFGASGMQAGDEMTSALKGIAGVAAMTSSEYEDISRIFTDISGSGRVMGDHLLQLSGRGLNAAKTLADSMGVTETEVREMVSKGKVDFETFYKAMDGAFGEHATKANETYSGSLSNMNAALARIGASVASPHMKNMRDIFNSLTPVINSINKGLAPFIDKINELGAKQAAGIAKFFNSWDTDDVAEGVEGVEARVSATQQTFRNFAEGVSNIISLFQQLLGPIGQAFANIFPSDKSGNSIVKLSEAFANLTSKLQVGTATADGIRRIFEALFAVLKFGFTIIGGVVSVILKLGYAIGRMIAPLLPVVGLVATLIETFFNLILATRIIQTAFKVLGNVLAGVGIAISWILKPIAYAINILSIFIDILTTGKYQGGILDADSWPVRALLAFTGAIQSLVGWIGRLVGRFRELVGAGLGKVGELLGAIGSKILEFVVSLKDLTFNKLIDGFKGLKNHLSGLDFSGLLTSFSEMTGIDFNGLAKRVRECFGNIAKIDTKGIFASWGKSINDWIKDIAKIDVCAVMSTVREGIVDTFDYLRSYNYAETYQKIASSIRQGMDFLRTHDFGEFGTMIRDQIFGVFDSMASRISTYAGPAMSKIRTVISKAFDSLKNISTPEGVLNAVTRVQDLMASLRNVDAKIDLGKFINPIKDFFKSLLEIEMPPSFTKVVDAVRDFFTRLGDISVAGAFSTGLAAVKEFFADLQTIAGNIRTGVAEKISAAIDATLTALRSGIDGIKTFASNIYSGIASGFSAVGNAIAGFASKIVGGITEAFFFATTGVLGINWGRVGDNIIASITGAFSGIGNFAFGLGDDIINGLTKAFDVVKAKILAIDWVGVAQGVAKKIAIAFAVALGAIAFSPILITNAITGAFDNVDMGPIGDKIKGIFSEIKSMFSGGGGDFSLMESTFGTTITGQIEKFAETIRGGIDKIKSVFASIGDFIGPIIPPIVEGFNRFKEAFGPSLMAIFDKLMAMDISTIFTSLGIFLTGSGFQKLGEGGFFSGISSALEGLTGALKTMQQEVQAKILLTIGIAVGVLALSLLVLAYIPMDKMKSGLLGLVGVLGALAIGMLLLSKIDFGKAGPAKLVTLSIALLGLGAAVLMMSTAMMKLSQLSWDEIGRGLVALAGAIVVMAVAVRLLPAKQTITAAISMMALASAVNTLINAIKQVADLEWDEIKKGLAVLGGSLLMLSVSARVMDGGKISKVSAAIAGLAIALNIMAYGMAKFEDISWDAIVKGLTTLGAMMAGLTVMTHFVKTKEIVQIALALGILSISMVALGVAMRILSSLEWDTIGKGLTVMGLILAVVGGALRTFPDMTGMAIRLLVVAATMLVFYAAMKAMASLEWDEIWRGLTGIGVGLLVMSKALSTAKMNPSSAAGILIMSASLLVLAAAMRAMAALEWDQIGRGLAGVGGSLAILVIAANLLKPGTALNLLGVAGALIVLAIGLGMMVPVMSALSSLGIEKLAIALGAIAALFLVIGLAGLAIGPVLPALFGLAGAMLLIGVAALAFGAGLALAAAGLATFAASGVAAIALIPALAAALAGAIVAFVVVIAQAAGPIAKAMSLIVVEIGKAILDALADLAGPLIETIVQIGILLIDGILDLAQPLLDGIIQLLEMLADAIIEAVPMLVDKLITLLVALADTITARIPELAQKGTDLMIALIEAVAAEAPRLGDAGAKAIIDFINATATSIEENGPALGDAMYNLASAMINGLINGITEFGERALNKARELGTKVKDAFASVLRMNSPSRVFHDFGKDINQGLANGMDSSKKLSVKASGRVASGVINETTKRLEIRSPSRVFHGFGENINQGLANGIDATAHLPADAITGTVDNMVQAYQRTQFSRRLSQIVNKAFEDHDDYMYDRTERAYDEYYRILDAVDAAEEAVEKANEEYEELGKREKEHAEKAREDSKNKDKDKKESQKEEKVTEADYKKARRKIEDAERKRQRAHREKAKLDGRLVGFEAGAAFNEGMADAILNEDEPVKTALDYITEGLMAEIDSIESKIGEYKNVFEGISTAAKSVGGFGDSIRNISRAFNRLNHATTPRSIQKNMGIILDEIINMIGGVQSLIGVLKVFEPFLPGLLAQFDAAMPGIIALIQPFAPQLASTLGGGLAAAIPLIAGPAAGIIAAIAGIGLFLYDQANDGKILKFVEKMFRGFIDFLKNLPRMLLSLIKTLLRGLVNTIKDLPRIITTIVDGLVDLFVGLIEAIPEILPELIAALAQAVVWIILNAPRILLEIGIAIVKGLVNGIGRAIRALLEAILNPFKFLAGEIGDELSLFNIARNAIRSLAEGFISAVRKLLELILSPFTLIVGLILGIFGVNVAKDTGSSFIGGLLKGITEAVRNGINFLLSPFRLLADGIRSILGFGSGEGIGGSLIGGIISGIGGLVGSAVNGVVGVAKGIVGAVKSFFGINSPSKVFRGLGVNLMEGLTEGIEKSGPDAVSVIDENGKDILDVARSIVDDIWEAMQSEGDFTITPVIDTSMVSRGAQNISRMLDGVGDNLSAGAYGRAIDISDAIDSGEVAPSSTIVNNITNVEFNQTNTSPKPLSELEIYRNTHQELRGLSI